MSEPAFTEQALLLGPRKSMVGILTQGAHPDGADRPLIVILNSGVIHRVGPNRMTVTLARRLTAIGFSVLRFDLSGIGDSEPRPDALSPWEASLADLREVLDALEAARGPLRVVLAGLCSGADQSVLYGGTDPRVVGMVLLDPSVPRTRRYYVNHYARRLVRWRSWANLVRGRHPFWRALKLRALAAPAAPRDDQVHLIDSQQVRGVLQRAYKASVDAGIRMLAVCTADRESRLNYREQLLDAFPDIDFRDRLRLEYFEQADHTFTADVERRRVIDLIVDWCAGTRFGKA